jgi:hypothetical protein
VKTVPFHIDLIHKDNSKTAPFHNDSIAASLFIFFTLIPAANHHIAPITTIFITKKISPPYLSQ